MGSIAGSNTAFTQQRQNTVDMIGELPDIDFFSIPGAETLNLQAIDVVTVVAASLRLYVTRDSSVAWQATTMLACSRRLLRPICH